MIKTYLSNNAKFSEEVSQIFLGAVVRQVAHVHLQWIDFRLGLGFFRAILSVDIFFGDPVVHFHPRVRYFQSVMVEFGFLTQLDFFLFLSPR